MINYNSAIPYIAGFYGEEHQLIQLAEEAAELAQAALKRHKALTETTPADTMVATRKALAEEIADVLIMCEQIIYLEGFEDRVREIIDTKIQRQIERIKGRDNDVALHNCR